MPRLPPRVLLWSCTLLACSELVEPKVEERWRYDAQAAATPPGLGPERRVVLALTSGLDDGLGGFVTLDERGPQPVEGPFGALPIAAPVPPVFVGSRVLFSTPIGRLVLADLAGQELENVSLGQAPSTPTGFAMRGTQLSAATSNGELVTVEGVDGSVLLRTALGSVPTSAPVYGADGTLYVATDDGQVRGFDSLGQMQFRVTMSGLASGPCVRDDGVVVAGDGAGVKAFAQNGSPLYERPRPARVVGTVPLGAGQVLAYGEDGAVERLDPMGGLVWRFQTLESNPPPVYWPPVVLDADHVLIIDDSGRAHLVGAEGTALAHYDLGARANGPAVLGSTGLVFVSVGASLRALGVVFGQDP